MDDVFQGIDGATYSDRYPSVPPSWRGKCKVKQTKYLDRSGTYVIEFVVLESEDARAPVGSTRSRVYTGLRGDPKITGVKLFKIKEFIASCLKCDASQPPTPEAIAEVMGLDKNAPVLKKLTTWAQLTTLSGKQNFLEGCEVIVETLGEKTAEHSNKAYIPTNFSSP